MPNLQNTIPNNSQFPDTNDVFGWNNPYELGFVSPDRLVSVYNHYNSFQLKKRDEVINIDGISPQVYETNMLFQYLCPEVTALNNRYSEVLNCSRTFRTFILETQTQIPGVVMEKIFKGFQREFAIEVFGYVYEMPEFKIENMPGLIERLEMLLENNLGQFIDLQSMQQTSDYGADNLTHAYEALGLMRNVHDGFKNKGKQVYVTAIKKFQRDVNLTTLMSSGMIFGILLSFPTFEYQYKKPSERQWAMNHRFSITAPGSEHLPKNTFFIDVVTDQFSYTGAMDANNVVVDDFISAGSAVSRVLQSIVDTFGSTKATIDQLMDTKILSANDLRLYRPYLDLARGEINWIFYGEIEFLDMHYDIYYDYYNSVVAKELNRLKFSVMPVIGDDIPGLDEKTIINFLSVNRDPFTRVEYNKVDPNANKQQRILDLIFMMRNTQLTFPRVVLNSNSNVI